MRLGLTGYFAVGLLIGLLFLAVVIHPFGGANDATTSPGSGGDNSGGGSDDGGHTGPVAPTCGDQQHYYKIKGTIRLYVNNDGTPQAQFVYVNVVRYTPEPHLPDFPALSWTTADYRVKVRYISPIGSIKTVTAWEGSVDYGEYKTVEFEVEVGHCNGGTLQLIVERMDGSNFITDTYNAMYQGG